MRLPRSVDFRQYAATALSHILVTIIVAQLVSRVTAAPTALSVSKLASLEPCQQIDCPVGRAVLDLETGACICPGSAAFRLLKIYEYLTRLLPSSNSVTHRRLQVRADITGANSATTMSSAETPEMTTFIPPPKTDITPALIQQSLSQQPQTLGQISSVQPFFRDGVIQFTMNLVGSAASNGMLLNASTKISASIIGENNEPSLIIVPQRVTNGTEIVTTEFATIVAVNMYSKDWMTFWAMMTNGTMVSLLSDCKVHDIDRIDPNTSAVSIMPSPFTGKKREARSASATASQNDADEITHRATLQAQEDAGVAKRGIEDVNAYNTKMTQGACEAMECTINEEKPLWNTFTRSCYCETSPPYWTVDPSVDPSIRGR